MLHKFYIEYFEPKHLKRANEMMDCHLNEVEKDRQHCQAALKKVLKQPTLWQKIKSKLRF